MRMWMLPPETMCRKHLLGEHVELHMLLGSLRRGKNIDGFLAGKLVDPRRMFRRHEELVLEMERRGYRHASPLDEAECETLARRYGCTGTPLSSGRAPCAVRAAGRRAAYGIARPCQGKRGPFHVEDRSRSEIPAPFHAGPTARTVRHSPTRRRRWTACRSSRHAPRRAFIRAKGGTVFSASRRCPTSGIPHAQQKKPKEVVLGLLHVVVVAGAGFEPTAFGL